MSDEIFLSSLRVAISQVFAEGTAESVFASLSQHMIVIQTQYNTQNRALTSEQALNIIINLLEQYIVSLGLGHHIYWESCLFP